MTLFFFRNELLFAFQRWRLSGLCYAGEQTGDTNPPIEKLAFSSCRKLWAHRVNSYPRFSALSAYFTGMETDVVLNPTTKKFEIHHPPSPPTGLVLDTYLAEIGVSHKKLWIDVKSIGDEQAEEAVGVFREYDRLYHIREDIIIESSLPSLVNELAANGFRVSFLVSPGQLDAPGTLPELFPEVQFVSQQDIYLEKMKKYFPRYKIITWSLSFDNYFNLAHLRSMVSDTCISIILINVKSDHYR